MRNHQYLISVIDMLLLCVVTLSIAIFAVKYDSNKGVDEFSFINMSLLTVTDDKYDKFKSYDFYPVILEGGSIKLYYYYKGNLQIIKQFFSIADFSEYSDLNASKHYVIYEQTKYPLLRNLIGMLVEKKIAVLIARPSKSEWIY